MGAWASLVAALALLAGCGGGGDGAAEPVATTAAAAVAETADSALFTDIADGLERIEQAASAGGACGSDLACTTGALEDLGAVADEELVGLEARVEGAELECLRDAGAWYVLALKRYALARDFAREGDIEAATGQVLDGSDNVTSAGAAAERCAAEVLD